jgi:polysaccharide biosynthesis transport protein
MLQTNRQSIVDEPAELSPQHYDLLQFCNGIIRQQFVIILAVTILATALGSFYVYVTPPIFAARATIILERGKPQAQLGALLREVPIDPVEAESQIQLIKSDAVVLAVIKKLNLNEDPEFVGPPPGLAGLIDRLRSYVLPRKGPVHIDGTQVVLSTVSRRLAVTRVGTQVIEIEFRSLDRPRAAEIANAFADCYIADQLNVRYQAARQAATWLQIRIEELSKQSALADEAVVQFKAKNNIVAAEGRFITEQQLAQLNTQLTLAREKTLEARTRLARIATIISGDPNERAGAVAETLINPVIVKLRSQYLELMARENDWSRRFGKDHLAVVALTRQIGEIRSSIADELRRIAETYKSDYEIAKRRQAEVEKTVMEAVARSQDANQAQSELRRLESSAETYRSLYKSTLQRNTELDQAQSFPGTEVRLITRASAPLESSGPKSILILVASAGGGLMLGFALGMARAKHDRVFRTPGQVETVLQADCVALVPALKARKAPTEVPLGSRVISRTKVITWEAVDRPLSRFAEAMRAIKSAADLGGRPAKVLGFTSSVPNEGKSTIGAAVALLAAHSGVRTLLIDCDLRNPALTHMLAPTAEHGLLDVISAKRSLEDVVWTDPSTKLTFLPGTLRSGIANSSAIMASPVLRDFFAELRKSYDCIVVDFPPVAPIIDVRATAGLVDAYVFLVEWARTKIDVAALALTKAPVVRENLLGVVLNKVDFKMLRQYEGHRSDYYSDKYYAQYGDDRAT